MKSTPPYLPERGAPLRGAVVGAGLMGRWHAHALVRSGGLLAAVVDPEPARARALAGRYRGASALRQLDELPADVQVVHICAPPESHLELTREVIARGGHALVEKPLAPTAAATAELLRLAEARGVLLCPVHQLLFQRGVLRLQRQLPRLGAIRHLDYVACSAGAEGRADAERDAVALAILAHPLSLLARLLPDALASLEWQLQHPDAGELRIAASAGGCSIGVLISMAGRPTRHTLRVIGEGGAAHLDLFHGFCVIERGGASRTRKAARPFLLSARTLLRAASNLTGRALRAEPAYPGLQELVRRFYEAVRGERAAPVSAKEAQWVASARDAIRARLAIAVGAAHR